MPIITREIQLRTKGHTEAQDITGDVARAVEGSGLQSGVVTLFCPGSTGGLTTIEFEEGVVEDLKQVLDEITPPDRDYRHHQKWGDDNGSSHIRAALVGPSLSVPFVNRKLTLGTWQQIVFIDFDTRGRARTVIVQIMGE